MIELELLDLSAKKKPSDEKTKKKSKPTVACNVSVGEPTLKFIKNKSSFKSAKLISNRKQPNSKRFVYSSVPISQSTSKKVEKNSSSITSSSYTSSLNNNEQQSLVSARKQQKQPTKRLSNRYLIS